MKTTLIYTFVVGCLAACTSASPPPPAAAAQKPVKWTLVPPGAVFKVGVPASVQIDAAIQDGWHIYSTTQPAGGPIATHFTVPDSQPFIMAGDPTPTIEPRVQFDSAFGMNVQLHEKAVGFIVPIRSIDAEPTAADSIRVNVRYQVCNATLCLPPQTAKLAAAAVVEAE
jgi:thiol:disulfide interchange protein DsbD